MKDARKRINIVLPESTVILLETVANKGERSSFIDNAIKAHIKQTRQQNIRQQLKEGAIARRERDANLADEWFEIEEELWQS